MLVVRRRGAGSGRGWCRFGGLWGRSGRGCAVSGGGSSMVSVLLSRGLVDDGPVLFPLRMLSFRSRLAVASGRLGGSRGL